MIHFITKKKEEYTKLIDTRLFNDVIIHDDIEGYNLFVKTAKGKREVYVDIEASDLDAYRAKLLLLGVKIKSQYFMFDHTNNIKDITEILSKKYVVGHNLKYDVKILKTNTGILIKKLYDTMIAEQRMFMGAGYRYSYDELVSRYIKEAVIKSTRNEFINANPETFKINYNHLNYLRTDLKHLPVIKKMQKERIHRQKQQFLIYGIENPFVSVVANAELIGFKLNREKWLNRIKKEQEKRFQVLTDLDSIVRDLRDKLSNVKREYLVGGKWDKERVRNNLVDLINADGTTEVIDLFGNPASSISLFGKSNKPTTKVPKLEEYPGCPKYTKQEVVHIFGALNQMAITEIETFSIPKFDDKGKLLNFNAYTIKADILERYLILRPDSVMKEFLNKFSELQKLNKSLSTYGKTFLGKIHETTGNIHTAFGQCFADTGRMTSGGGKNEPDKINGQNLPRDLELRQAFETDEGYLLGTDDYSGAELVIMASHAQDFKLLELSKGDMHSHFATQGWREVYKIRAAGIKPFLTNSSLSANEQLEYQAKYAEYYEKSIKFTVTKNEPEGFRQVYKPVAFGVIYGAYPKKISQVLNIGVEEGKGVINSVVREIPKTIAFVEAQSEFAERYGYVIHNKRTNSRRWFPALIKQIKGEYNLKDNFLDISSAKSEARNSTIQGTQADFIKEASVKLQYYYWKNNLDADIVLWVHDEIVDRRKEEDAKYIGFIKHEILTTVANKYLNNVTIEVEQALFPYWTK